MIKIGYGSNKVIVSLTTTEFTALAGDTYNNVPDGSDVSLVPIKNKVDLVDSKTAELLELKTKASEIIDTLNSIGI